ncbi:MAG: hypothetical protein LBO79_03835, partial [Zoogloeaceae bacterium]|nr:hypothetical protein [Zoogloeaceae bacterium]
MMKMKTTGARYVCGMRGEKKASRCLFCAGLVPVRAVFPDGSLSFPWDIFRFPDARQAFRGFSPYRLPGNACSARVEEVVALQMHDVTPNVSRLIGNGLMA